MIMKCAAKEWENGKAAGLANSLFSKAGETEPSQRSSRRGRRSTHSIALKGRAWIEEDNLQIVRIETDLQAPLPEIKLLAEHVDIEFGPVTFRNKKESMWLPMTADIYMDLKGRRIRRMNAFNNYLLFSVDDRQSIFAPREANTTPDSAPAAG